MRIIKCAGAILIDNSKKILLEDRRNIKKHGEHWSFFGGSIEKNENKEQALCREIFEELNYKIIKYKYFKKYTFRIKDMKITYYMYIAPTPDMNTIKVHSKAKAKKFTIKQALRLKITDIDKKILRDVEKYLNISKYKP